MCFVLLCFPFSDEELHLLVQSCGHQRQKVLFCIKHDTEVLQLTEAAELVFQLQGAAHVVSELTACSQSSPPPSNIFTLEVLPLLCLSVLDKHTDLSFI